MLHSILCVIRGERLVQGGKKKVGQDLVLRKKEYRYFEVTRKGKKSISEVLF